MNLRLGLICSVALTMATIAAASARDFEMGGDSQYPNSIMRPEPGAATHHRARTRRGALYEPGTNLAKRPPHSRWYPVRGSSGSVLPTPLPRTPLIPPEGGAISAVPATPQQQGPTVLPGMNPIPNLPHGTETFQDRASRCAFQQGLYGVPNSASSQYMHACAM